MTKIEKYREYRNTINKYSYAVFIMSFDEQTICPKKDKENSLDVQDYFREKVLAIKTSDEYYNLLKYLADNPKGLTDIELMAIKKEYIDITKTRRIPFNVLVEGMKIASSASLEWEKARDTLDYSSFEEKLDKLIDYNFKKISYLEDKYKGFDVLLDEMEDDLTEEAYDNLFDKLEAEILPLMQKILSLPKRYNPNIKNEKFDIDKQKKLTKRICELMGYTNEVGYIGETIHPFTDSANVNDVRTTTRYDEGLLFSNLYSVMHEIGHALYELQNNKELSNTVLFGGTSCAIHESQSRFYENYLGRSREFIEFLYPILVEIFPEEISKYTVDDIYYYVNDVSNQFTRTEADELTYPFHVIIRYRIERMLFHREIKAKDIDRVFNELFMKYFGVAPKNKKEGCFQDVHWSNGFGYFPTYTLGTAMSAQFLNSMKKDFDPLLDMKHGDFTRVNSWLKDHIHKYGASKKNMEIIKIATNEDFNPEYYINYLKEKFTKLYNL